jgi:hypothetical protein
VYAIRVGYAIAVRLDSTPIRLVETKAKSENGPASNGRRMAIMLRLKTSFPADWSLADFWKGIGRIPLHRIRMVPPPGTATEKDLLSMNDRTNRLCELIDGVLVEKTMGAPEGYIAGCNGSA